jgi:peroxiredoxin (alkyl hydroperoxide reductase subunit C)
MEEFKLPLLGEEFPEINVKTTHGKLKLPDYFSGKWFVLFSHPGDFTPVCTTEFVAFAKAYPAFKKMNCELIGLSIDQVFSHMKWTEWIKNNLDIVIPFPIIADDMGMVATELGMVHPSKGSNTVRAVFVMDRDGIVRMMLYYPQEIGRNIDEIIRSVRALQASEKHKVAMPANWPNNDIIGSQAIIPPASDEKKAKENSKKYKCYDWWFCYRKIK